MKKTEHKLVYLAARNSTINGWVPSLHDGGLLLNIPNYTQVYLEPPEPQSTDEHVYALRLTDIPDTCVVEIDEGAGPVFRAWNGPLDSRQYPNHPVQARIYPIDSPFAEDGNRANELLAKAREEAQGLLTKLDEANKDLSAARDRIGSLEGTVDDYQKQIAKKDYEIGGHKAQIADLSAGNAPATVEALADLLLRCSDDVVKEMPYIGDSNVGHLKKWADEVAASTDESAD